MRLGISSPQPGGVGIPGCKPADRRYGMTGGTLESETAMKPIPKRFSKGLILYIYIYI